MQNMQEPSDAVTDAWVRLVRAERQVVGQIEAELRGAGFPSLPWYDVLLHLKRRADGRSSPREIEEAVLFEQYNLSRLLDRMGPRVSCAAFPIPATGGASWSRSRRKGERCNGACGASTAPPSTASSAKSSPTGRRGIWRLCSSSC